jgi:hypothetical protein
VFRILVGQEAAVTSVQRAAATRKPVKWIVPKAAKPGDEVALFFPHVGFLARGSVISLPKPTVYGRKKTCSADIGKIVFFAYPVLLEDVAKEFSSWGWTTYPRSYTTPPIELAEQIRSYLLRSGSEAKPVAATARRHSTR